MKRIIITAAFSLLSFIVHAQTEGHVQWGPVLENKTTPDILLKDDSSMYMVYSRLISSADMGDPTKIKYSVGRMHRDLTHMVTSPIKFARHSHYQFHAVIDKTIYFFTSVSDTTRHETVLYAQPVNKKTLSLEPRVRVIALAGTYLKADFWYTTSPDSMKTVICSSTNRKLDIGFTMTYGITTPRDPDRISFWVVDQHLAVLSSNDKPVTFLKQGQTFTNPQCSVDNSGDVYLLGRVYGSTLEWADRSDQPMPPHSIRHSNIEPSTYAAHYKYFLAMYPKAGSVIVLPIDAGVSIRHLTLLVSKQQEIFLTGLYGKDFESSSTGCIVLKVKKKSDVYLFKTLQPCYDLIVNGVSKDEVAGLSYRLGEPSGIAMADGSLIVSLPVELLNHPIRPRVEMLLMRFTPQGDVAWERKFTKDFYKYGKPPAVGFFRAAIMRNRFRVIDKLKFAGIREIKNGDSICYLYNTKLPQDALVMTSVALDGTITSRVIVANSNFNVLPLQISREAKALIVPRRDGNNLQLGRIDLK